MNDKKITIKLRSILKDVIRNFWVILLVVLIGRMSIYVVNHSVYNPEYTATAIMVVTAKESAGAGYSSFAVSAELAEVFSNIFKDPIVKTRAGEHLGRAFDGEIGVYVNGGTNFIDLSVTSESPQNSYEMLNAVIAVYPTVSDYVFDNATVMVLKEPSVPSTPSNRISSDNIGLIQSGCAVVATSLVVLFSVLRDTVKSEEDFKNKIGAKLLGVIGHETKKVSLKDFITKKRKHRSLRIYANPYVSFRFVETMYKIAAKIEYLNNRNQDKIFMITSVAENEGKSTVASNIALALAGRGKKVLLVDFDFKKPAIYKIFDAQTSECSELGNLFNNKIESSDYKFLRYKNIPLYFAMNTKPYKEGRQWVENGDLEKFLSIVSQQVDFVIIDTSPLAADSLVSEIARFSDRLIMVTKADAVRAEAINKSIDTFKNVGARLGGCILNDAYTNGFSFGFRGVDESGSSHYSKQGKYGKYGKYGSYNKPKNYIGYTEDVLD